MGWAFCFEIRPSLWVYGFKHTDQQCHNSFLKFVPWQRHDQLKPPFPRPEIVESTGNYEVKTSITPKYNNDDDEEDDSKKNMTSKNHKKKNKKSKDDQRKRSFISQSPNWQVLIEEDTFKSVHLKWDDSHTNSELPTFDNAVNGHLRRLLKNINLEMMLEQHDCLVSGRPESELEIDNNNLRFTIAMQLLFSSPQRLKRRHFIDLYHSFPDVEHDAHCVRHDHIQQAAGTVTTVMTNPAAAMYLLENPNGEKEGVIGNLLHFKNIDIKLPELPFIHQLVVNRSTTRSFAAKAIKKLLKHLTGLERVV
ncbi:hypothetical protein GCG54_00008845 [Colletotrichum gloeosporioides]|uniref:Uncharacterized protein n=1 Tax=Colletotrichum gloeosporioides TaxID=474922 RepID=A0A8H4CNS3_COLGL|nr:uncharacterized protein GCG54_00008845 [Colletotrichum gloeosporioides]KAF3807388.1 hypothetical protein GCG54_00008845 [Colletotrichum gloeosporioides]